MRASLPSCAVFLALAACGTGPEPADGVGPEVHLSQVGPASVSVLVSSIPEVRTTLPVPVCPDGRRLDGAVWEVSAFPIEVLASAADPAAIERLRLTSDGGTLSSPDPPSVSLTTGTVAGREVEVAEMVQPRRRRRPMRFFTVRLDLRPGVSSARLEATARDYGGMESSTGPVTVGTLEDLCAALRTGESGPS